MRLKKRKRKTTTELRDDADGQNGKKKHCVRRSTFATKRILKRIKERKRV